jgi:hypothetical protein
MKTSKRMSPSSLPPREVGPVRGVYDHEKALGLTIPAVFLFQAHEVIRGGMAGELGKYGRAW